MNFREIALFHALGAQERAQGQIRVLRDFDCPADRLYFHVVHLYSQVDRRSSVYRSIVDWVPGGAPGNHDVVKGRARRCDPGRCPDRPHEPSACRKFCRTFVASFRPEFDEINVQVCVRQSHERSRQTPMLLSVPRGGRPGGRRCGMIRRYPRGTCHSQGIRG